MEDDDIDSVFNVLSALSSLNGSVSGLNATVEIVGNLVGIFTANSSLISADRGQVITCVLYVIIFWCVRLAIYRHSQLSSIKQYLRTDLMTGKTFNKYSYFKPNNN